jgi:hypothetical protein
VPFRGWLVAVLLLGTWTACRSRDRESKPPAASPPARPAAEAATEAAAEPVPPAAAPDAGPEGGGADAPAEVAAAPEAATDEFRPPGGWFEPLDPGTKCGEGPERRAARENMRRMAEQHAQLGAALATLRAELRSQAAAVAESLELDLVSSWSADLARRNGELRDAAPVEPGYLAALLREAAFWGALCRTFDTGRLACDALDEDGADTLCLSVARLTGLGRRRPERTSLVTVISRAFGWPLDRARDEQLWRLVSRDAAEASCEGIPHRPPPNDWPLPLCRAVTARDVSRCDTLRDGLQRRACAALVQGFLGPGAATGDVPGAAGAFLRERIAPTGPRAACADALAPMLDELVESAQAFKLGPFTLPSIELERGLAPTP